MVLTMARWRLAGTAHSPPWPAGCGRRREATRIAAVNALVGVLLLALAAGLAVAR